MIERTQTRPPRRASLRRTPPGDLAAPKNHRFLEVLALLTLVTPWFNASGPPTPAVSPLLAVHTVAALAALGALVYPPLRRAAWVSFLAAGLLSILVTPGSFSGILLVLFGAFLIFDSGWASRRPLAIAGGLAGLTVAAQVGSCLVHPDGLVRQVVQWGLVDTLVLVLPVSFRKNVAIKVEDHRPTWILEAFKLTS